MEPKRMTGKFDYHNGGVGVLHYIPQGEACDGCPVIVFPQKESEVVCGRAYKFWLVMTNTATYVVDGVTYRVGHANSLVEVGEREADLVDQMQYRHDLGGNTTLADSDGGNVLAALKASMEA